MIQDAFLTLMMKKAVVEIKVREVIELANISKGTFYAHYNGLHEVQQAIEDRQLALLFQFFDHRDTVTAEDCFYPLFLSGLQVMSRDRGLFRLLFCTTYSGTFLSKLKNTFLEHLLSYDTVTAPLSGPDGARAYLSYVAGGAIAVIQEWLENGATVDPEMVAHFLSDCALEGLRGVRLEATVAPILQ